jgi:hypothetical protein
MAAGMAAGLGCCGTTDHKSMLVSNRSRFQESRAVRVSSIRGSALIKWAPQMWRRTITWAANTRGRGQRKATRRAQPADAIRVGARRNVGLISAAALHFPCLEVLAW